MNLKKANVARANTIRHINRQIVLNYVREKEPISRAEISHETALQRSTVSLIVEDDGDIRDSLTQILREEGYAVTGVANGQEALDHLHRAGPSDLILLDLMMPVMDGWQFRIRQQEDPDLAAIPVVVLSADGNVRRKAEALGAQGALAKPFDLDSLLDAVTRLCS